MNRLYGIALLLLISPHGWTQTAGLGLSGFETSTPAQSDWTNWPEGFAMEQRATDRPTGERISVERLRHTPPRKAQALFQRGLKFAMAGVYQKAIKEFELAVSIDPGFSEAHGNLGVEYLAAGLLDKAASAFRLAIKLDPATSVHHSNLAYVLSRIGFREEAEREVQTAIALDPSNLRARCLLGIFLADHQGSRAQAVEQLLIAARGFPPAHLILAQMYRAEGNESVANLELERYREAAASDAYTAGTSQ